MGRAGWVGCARWARLGGVQGGHCGWATHLSSIEESGPRRLDLLVRRDQAERQPSPAIHRWAATARHTRSRPFHARGACRTAASARSLPVSAFYLLRLAQELPLARAPRGSWLSRRLSRAVGMASWWWGRGKRALYLQAVKRTEPQAVCIQELGCHARRAAVPQLVSIQARCAGSKFARSEIAAITVHARSCLGK